MVRKHTDKTNQSSESNPQPRIKTTAQRKTTNRVITQETPAGDGPVPQLIYQSDMGKIYCGDSLRLLRSRTKIAPGSVNLIMTSPPFGLVRKKEYGNVDADEYVKWFKNFGRTFYNLLSDNGSLVIDIGGAWEPGQPTRSLYHYELLIMLCRQIGFHLAQEFYWWNPSRLPTPAEWVNVRRIRVKDAVNTVWWLSKTPWPKASNLRVLQPYSPSMRELLEKGYKAKLRPSGHDISENFNIDNGASIPPNLLAIANTESNSAYLRYCEQHNIPAHPARYPTILPEFFIRMLTDPGDLVVDPFAGSCVTGEAAERLRRRWICSELRPDYVEGALGRFQIPVNSSMQVKSPPQMATQADFNPSTMKFQSRLVSQLSLMTDITLATANVQLPEDSDKFYKLPRPGLLWDETPQQQLSQDGGKVRPTRHQSVSESPQSEGVL